VVEINRIPGGHMEVTYSNTALVAASTSALEPPVPLEWRAFGSSTVDLDRAVGLGRSIRILWEDRISCIAEVYFKIKDTFQ